MSRSFVFISLIKKSFFIPGTVQPAAVFEAGFPALAYFLKTKCFMQCAACRIRHGDAAINIGDALLLQNCKKRCIKPFANAFAAMVFVNIDRKLGIPLICRPFSVTMSIGIGYCDSLLLADKIWIEAAVFGYPCSKFRL